MIELTNVLFANTKFLETIAKINDNEGLPVKQAFRINKLTKILAERAKDYEEIRMKLLTKYGEPQVDEDENQTGSYQIEPKNINSFNKDFEELMNENFSIDLEKIPYPEELTLSPAQLGLVEDIFDFGDLV